MGVSQSIGNKEFGNAVFAFKNGQREKAEIILNSILARSRSDHNCLELLSIIKLQNGNFSQAVKYSKKAYSIKKNSERYAVNYSMILAQTGDTPKAIDVLTKFTYRYQNQLCALNELVNLLLSAKKFEKAIKILKHLRETQPKSADIHFKLGISYQYIEEFDLAKASYLKSIPLGTPSANTHSNLGSIYLLQNDTISALREFKKALNIDPNHYSSNQNVGHEFARNANYQEAIPYLEKAIFLNPTDFSSTCELANAMAVTQNPKKAIKVCEQALNTTPNQLGVLIQYAFSLFINREYKKSVKISRRALELNPGNISAMAFLASALNEIGDRAGAAYYLDFRHLIKVQNLNAVAPYKTICEFNKALESAIYAHPTLTNKESNRSLSKGRCTSNLFDGNETMPLIHLKEKILHIFEDYKIERPVDPSHPFLFQHADQINIYCWANVMDEGGFHNVHFHPTAWLSGVYYPKLPEEITASNSKSNEGFLEFGRAYYQLLSSDDPPVHLVPPKEGLIVLTPSYFGHRTIPFKSKDKRISIAFDIIPKTFIN